MGERVTRGGLIVATTVCVLAGVLVIGSVTAMPSAAVVGSTMFDQVAGIPGGTPSGSVVVDVNGDGRNDLVTLSESSPSSIAIWHQQPFGDLVFADQYSIVGGARSLDVGDLDGDGRVDIVVAGWGYDNVYLLYQTSAGTFTTTTVPWGDTPYVVRVADMNVDGRSDVVTMGDSLKVATQASDGSLSAPVASPWSITYASSFAVADLTGDGRPDVVTVPNFSAAETVSVITQGPDGTFASTQGYDIGGTNAQDAVVGDFTGDGRADIAVSFLGGTPLRGRISVLPGLAGGGFGTGVLYGSTPFVATSLRGGDLNGDGRDDVVGMQISWGALVFLQAEDGTLEDPLEFPPLGLGWQSLSPDAVAIGDVNGDDALDVVYPEAQAGPDFLYNTAVNRAPVGTGGTLHTTVDNPLTLGLDVTDPDGDELVPTVLTPPQHGTVDIAGGSVEYQPAAGFVGTDRVDVRVYDGRGRWVDVEVEVIVDPAPPTDVVAAPGAGSALVSWQPPNPGADSVTAYRVVPSPFAPAVTVPASQMAARLTGLVPGETYAFTVTALTGSRATSTSLPSPAVLIGDENPVEAYNPLRPARLLDTRGGTNFTTVDAAEEGGGALGVGEVRSLPVVGRGGVPADGVGAVVLNVTVTEPSATSFLTVFPGGQARPLASSVNVVAGQTVANAVVVKPGADGTVALYNDRGSAHVVVDVQGWFAEGDSYGGLTPARVLDTRSGFPTVDGLHQGGGALGVGEVRSLPVVGRGGVPADGVGAVVLNVTVTEPSATSFLTVFPGGQARPLASSVNVVAGQTVANAVVVKPGADGTVALYNDRGSAHVVVDVQGWFAEGDSYGGLTPARVLDTRSGFPTVDGLHQGGGALGVGEVRSLPVVGRGGVPADGVGAVVLNVTVTEPSATSFLTVFPGGQARPLASSVNVVAGQTVANAVVVKPGADGTVALYNDRGSAHVVVDVAGWMPPGATVVDVGAGTSHSLALRSDGSVFAWGDNHAGQLGDGGATLGTSVPQQVLGLGPGSPVTAISAGAANNLALTADGAVLSWGGNYYGQLGSGSTDLTSDVPVQVSGLGPGSGVVEVSTAGSTGLALKRDGTVLAWGDNSVGQLGNNGDEAFSSVPVQVSGLGSGSGVVAISAGPTSSLALKADGTVLAWGDNSYGQLGNETYYPMSKVPVVVKGMGAGSDVIAVASGDHNVAMMLDGRLWSWGNNAGGALGAGHGGGSSHKPLFVLGLGQNSNAASVDVGRTFTLVVRGDGSVSGWGVDDFGQLTGLPGTHAFATQLTGFGPGVGPRDVSAGDAHSLAIDEDGFVKAWGHSFYGALGNGPDGDAFQRTPELVVAI